MNINDFKIKYLSPKAQVAIFDTNGKLIGSCDTLLNFSIYKEDSLFKSFAFLESIQAALIALTSEDGELYFPRIEVSFDNKEWVFDFTFFKDEKTRNIVWVLQDLTKQYHYLLNVQQERNESIIKEELMQTQNRCNTLQKEVVFLNKLHKLRIAYLARIVYYIKKPIKRIEATINEIYKIIGDKLSKNKLVELTNAFLHLNQNVNELEAFSKTNAHDLEFEEKNFQLAELLWANIQTFNLDARKRNVPILFHVQKEVPRYLVGDEKRLSQILYNLLSNSVKFTTEGRIAIDVEVKEQINNKIILLFKVSDTGTGIPEERIAQIFDLYAHFSPKENQLNQNNGIGVGLTIVKELVELLGGEIAVESEVNKGTTFAFSLPFQLTKK